MNLGWIICEKSEKMSAYLFELLDDINPNQKYFTIITPRNPQQRAVSIYFNGTKRQGGV